MSYQNAHSFVVGVNDPTADNEITCWVVPTRTDGIEILSAYVHPIIAGTASTTNYYQVGLKKIAGGTGGTTTVASQIGGTPASGTAPGWTVGSAYALTIAEGTLDDGDWLLIDYDETGTPAAVNFAVQVDYAIGIGAS